MQGKKVLFVDDDSFIQASGKALLTVLKTEFVIAGGGVEAVKIFESSGGKFNSLVIDIHMPDKDGYEVCKELRAIEKSKGWARSKMIAMSGGILFFFIITKTLK